MRSKPLPRAANCYGMRETAHVEPDGSWLEPESITYPSGGFLRRAYVFIRANKHNPVSLPYGELRVVKCSIPDTFFSIPARLATKDGTIRGYISTLDDRLCFTPEANPEACTVCQDKEGCKRT